MYKSRSRNVRDKYLEAGWAKPILSDDLTWRFFSRRVLCKDQEWIPTLINRCIDLGKATASAHQGQVNKQSIISRKQWPVTTVSGWRERKQQIDIFVKKVVRKPKARVASSSQTSCQRESLTGRTILQLTCTGVNVLICYCAYIELVPCMFPK